MRPHRDAAESGPSRRSNCCPPSAPRRSLSWPLRILMLVTVVAFVIPSGALPAYGSAAILSSASAPHAVAAPASISLPVAPTARAPPVPAVFPGEGGSQGTPIVTSGPNVEIARPSPASIVPKFFASQSSTPTMNLFSNSSALTNHALPPAIPVPSMPKGPLGYTIPTGSFSGFINDSTDRLGIAGITGTVFSKTICPTNICSSFTTNSSGYFIATCPAPGGPGSYATIQIQDQNWYTDNESFDTCVANTAVYVGTIFLVRNGVATGFVEDQVSGKPIVGVQVYAETRDGDVYAYPTYTTGTSGAFTIGVPPVPSKIVFQAPTGYLSTFNYTNATPGTGARPAPWGGGTNLGIILMEHQTLVKAEVYNSMSGSSPNEYAALTGCDSLGNGCQNQGPTIQSGNVVHAWVNPGANYFEAYVAPCPTCAGTHFMEAYTPTMTIPEEPLGTAFDIGAIYVVPMGQFKTVGGFSTPTGGKSPPWGAPGAASVYAQICSDDGYYTSSAVMASFGAFNMTSDECISTGCWSLGSQVTLPAPPLRSYVQVIPDTTGYCNPFAGPQWPIPGYTPVWINDTYVNITAGQLLGPVAYVNFTPGDYIAGNVYGLGYGEPPNKAPLQPFQVTYTSTDNSFWNGQGYSWQEGSPSAIWSPCSSLGTQTGSSFCLAVPPGNSKVSVTAPDYASNWSWVHVPDYCCRTAAGGSPYPSLLYNATSNHITSINITGNTGKIYGYVVRAENTTSRIPLFTVSVCPAAGALSGIIGCATDFGYNGTFWNVQVPAGMMSVSIQAAGYSTNSVLINVTVGGNISAGTIPLFGLGVLQGKVVDPSGNGIPLAQIRFCPVALGESSDEGSCFGATGGTQLGTGISSAVGGYNGTVPGGWLPWATYLVTVNANGYTNDFTFGNASASGITTLPTVTLQPLGTNQSHARSLGPHPAAGSTSGGAGAWVQGRVIDNGTGQGVSLPGNVMSVCPFGGSTALCAAVADGSNSEGYFNTSVGPGLYYLNITASGFMPASFFFNATLAGWLDLGQLDLVPDWWVAGQVVIHQWESISTSTLTNGGSFGNGYAPSATATGCNNSRSTCLYGLPVSSNGTYNVSVPVGPSATISFTATGAAYGGALAGGFDANTTTTNLSGPFTYLTGSNAFGTMDIFGIISGTIWNNNTINDTANKHFPGPAFGLPYASVTVQEKRGPNPASLGFTADGSGHYILFMPGGDGPNVTQIIMADSPGYTAYSFNQTGPGIQFGDHPAINQSGYLSRFGWITTTFNSTEGVPVPDVQVNTQYTDIAANIAYTTSDNGNYAGYANVTTPFGADVMVDISAPDFNQSNFTVLRVNGSATTAVEVHTLDPYGWLISDTLNYTDQAPPITSYPAGVVIDSSSGMGLPGAAISVTSSDTAVTGGSSPVTNWLGQFYSDAPIGLKDTLEVSHNGYVNNETIYAVAPGSYRVLPTVNMTGDAVIAGVVTAYPSGRPVAGAQIQACVTVKTTTVCTLGVQSNASGVFWLALPPGEASVTVSQLNYVSNSTVVRSCSDCWLWTGDMVLNEFSELEGFVRGLPSGLPVEGALASVCSPLGSPVGPCQQNVTSNQYGEFELIAPPSTYVLQVADSNYNTTYFPVGLAPGELTNVGTLFLSEFGTVTGRVYDFPSYAPITGATVEGCNSWVYGTCAPPVLTDSTGTYSFSAAPGTYNITASDGGHQTGTQTIRIRAGETSVAPPIVLSEIGNSNTEYTISGTVETAPNGAGVSTPLIGASVAACLSTEKNCTATGSGTTGAGGAFSFQVPFGVYNLVATDVQLGFRPVQHASVTVFANVVGQLFQLSPMTFNVTGYVNDSLTHAGLAGVAIYAQEPNGSLGALLATTLASGYYRIPLSNGSHVLTATVAVAKGSGDTLYATLGTLNGVTYAPAGNLTPVVNDGGQTYNMVLSPPSAVLTITVLDETTGLPISGASVTVAGDVEPGVPVSRTLTTGLTGLVTLATYEGSYLVTASFGSYHAGSKAITVAPPSTKVTISLAPIASAASVPSSTGGWALWAAAAGALGAVGVAALLAGRPFRRPPSARAVATPRSEP